MKSRPAARPRPPRHRATAGDYVFALGMVAFTLVAAGALLVATGGTPPFEPYLAGFGLAGSLSPGTPSPVARAQPSPSPVHATAAPTPVAPTASRAPIAPTASPAPVVPSAAPSAVAAASQAPAPAASAAPHGPYTVNLYRPGVFVHQVNKEACVAAAVQNILNVIRSVEERRRPDVTARTQRALYARIVALTTHDDSHNGGTGPGGWADLLTQEGYPYELRVFATRNQAVAAAARALRETSRPVGILAWQGVHSWVMTGFTSTADPLSGQPFAVTTAYVLDPWYPWVSTRWPRSEAPNAPRDAKDLAANILPWKLGSGPYPGRDGKFLVVLPLAH